MAENNTPAPSTDSPLDRTDAARPATSKGAEQEAAREADGPTRSCRLVAIASGKGGVGKSLLAASVGIYLAQLDRRVVLADFNVGSGNLHTILGIDETRPGIDAFMRGETSTLSELVNQTTFSGLGLISAQNGRVITTSSQHQRQEQLFAELHQLAADYVVLDLAAGSGPGVLDPLTTADLQIVVTQPEPTAIESAFRLLKSAFVHRVKALPGLRHVLRELEPTAHRGVPAPKEIYDLAKRTHPELAGRLDEAMATFHPALVVNQTRTREDLELGPALAQVSRRHLGLALRYLGHMEYDDLVGVCVHRRKPLLVEYPEAKMNREVERIARRILASESEERAGTYPFPPSEEQNHYDILGLHAAATEEEIRKAARRIRRLYDPGSSAITAVTSAADAQQFLSRAEEAYATLIDPEKQQAYNLATFPESGNAEGQSTPAESTSGTTQLVEPSALFRNLNSGAPPPEMPQIDESTCFSGSLLRQIREAGGVDLRELAGRTKISMAYLNAIEEEDYRSIPAPVYLRGFVKSVAKCLKLEADRVANSYMQRYEATR